MGLVIVWRNPQPVQTIRRCTRMSKNVSFARYFLEELMGRTQEETWIDTSTMEVLRGGNISEPCAKKPAINASRGAGAKGSTRASTDGRRVSSLQTPLEPIIALLRRIRRRTIPKGGTLLSVTTSNEKIEPSTGPSQMESK
jgi:hypothetical protein